jgi:hypothetical protein
MEKVIKISEKVNFTSIWGVIASPIPYEDGYILPLGWEEELDKRNISYTIIDYTPPPNDLD